MFQNVTATVNIYSGCQMKLLSFTTQSWGETNNRRDNSSFQGKSVILLIFCIFTTYIWKNHHLTGVDSLQFWTDNGMSYYGKTKSRYFIWTIQSRHGAWNSPSDASLRTFEGAILYWGQSWNQWKYCDIFSSPETTEDDYWLSKYEYFLKALFDPSIINTMASSSKQ